MVAVLTSVDEQVTHLAPPCGNSSSLTPVAELIALADALDLELDALVAQLKQLKQLSQQRHLSRPTADRIRSPLPDRVDGPSM